MVSTAELSFQYSLFRSTASEQDNQHAFAEGISSVCISTVFDETLPSDDRGGSFFRQASMAKDLAAVSGL